MTVSDTAQEAPTDPKPMPILAREQLVVRLMAGGLSERQTAVAAISTATRAGYSKTGLSRGSVTKVHARYIARVQEQAADELRDSWELKRERLYGYLADWHTRFVEASVLDDEERMANCLKQLLAIEDRISKLEGLDQDSDVDIDAAMLTRYAHAIGFDDMEISEMLDLANTISASDRRGAFRVIEGGQ